MVVVFRAFVNRRLQLVWESPTYSNLVSIGVSIIQECERHYSCISITSEFVNNMEDYGAKPKLTKLNNVDNASAASNSWIFVVIVLIVCIIVVVLLLIVWRPFFTNNTLTKNNKHF